MQTQRGNAESLFLPGTESSESSQHHPHDDDHSSLSVSEVAAAGPAVTGLREYNMHKFLGKWRKVSGDEGHRCEITLRERGTASNLFLKLSIEQEGHFAELDANNFTKIHVRHNYGFATFTIDYSEKYLTEENHSDGTNWVWKWEPPSVSSRSNVVRAVARFLSVEGQAGAM